MAIRPIQSEVRGIERLAVVITTASLGVIVAVYGGMRAYSCAPAAQVGPVWEDAGPAIERLRIDEGWIYRERSDYHIVFVPKAKEE